MGNRAAVWTASIAATAACVAIYSQTIPLLRQTGGIALFPLDDTYIHLALGRTVAESGVWGVAPGAPAAASSSPLWTLILAAGRFVFPGDVVYSWLPLVLNVLAAVALIAVWARVLSASNRQIASGLLALTLGSALPALALLGLEHVLQCLATLVLAWTAAGWLASEAERRPLAIGGLCALATATRYESLFIVLPIAIAFLVRKRRAEALAAVGGALVPVFLFGVLWVVQGGAFLPNAVMLKGPGATDRSLGVAAASVLANLVRNVAGHLVGAPRGLIAWTLFVLMTALWSLRRFGSARDRYFSSFVLWATATHTVLGQFGWLFRYEAWLVSLAAAAILRLAGGIVRTTRGGAVVVAAALFAALAPRAWAAAVETSRAPSDRLWEHFGTAAVFNQSSLSNRAILANDVGVLAYIHRGRPVDLYGLADNIPVVQRRAGAYGPDEVSDLARRRGAEVGAVQLCWPEVNVRFPSGWRLIEVWQGPRNVVFGDLIVAFIATPEAADLLTEAMRQAVVPAGVERWTQDDPRVAGFNSADDKRTAAYDGLCQY